MKKKEPFLLLSRLIEQITVMLRFILMLLFAAGTLAIIPSCNSNKIACPTYADSFPEKKAKKQTKAPVQKASKTKSGLLPPNARKR